MDKETKEIIFQICKVHGIDINNIQEFDTATKIQAMGTLGKPARVGYKSLFGSILTLIRMNFYSRKKGHRGRFTIELPLKWF